MLDRAGGDGANDRDGASRPRALGPLSALAHSFALLKQRPFATLGLGAALVSSGLAVCCGLGLFAAPWFMCELFALHIESARGQALQRSAAWLAAGLVQLAGLVVLSLLALFALLSLGPDVLLGVEQAPGALALLESLAWLLAAGALAIALGVHFEYAPALLIEHGGSLRAALFASSRMVAQSGVFCSWLTSALAHALPVLMIAGLFALQSTLAGRVSGLLMGLLALPLVALGCALGQGMIVASYLALAPTRPIAPRAPSSVRAGIPAFVAIALILAGPLPVIAALLRPSELTRGALPAGAALLLDVRAEETAREPYVPDSALRLVIDRARLQVVASDGGGAGSLPLPAIPIEQVRVAPGDLCLPEGHPSALSNAAELRSSEVRCSQSRAGVPRSPLGVGASVRAPGEHAGFAIEVRLADGSSYLTMVDDSGVRRDDSLERRFLQALPAWPRLLLALCWVWLSVWLVRVLPRQAELYFAADEASFTQVARRAWLGLLVPALLAPGIGVWSLLH